MKQSRYKLWISILSVLLAIVSFALTVTLIKLSKTFAQGSATSPDNVIEQQTSESLQPTPDRSTIPQSYAPGPSSYARPIEASPMIATPAQMTVRPTLSSFFSASDPERIRMTDEGSESATPIVIENLFPGDTYTKRYIVTVKDDTVTAIQFSFAFSDLTQNPTEAQQNRDQSLMTMRVTANGTEVFNGPLTSTVDVAPYLMDGTKEVVYEVSVSLATSAGNEYSRVKMGMKTDWESEYDPIYSIVYYDGANDSIFPRQTYYVKIGDPVPAFVGTPQRPGYRFLRWTPEFSETATASVMYTPVWDELYTVTYSDGSTEELYFADQKYSDLVAGSNTPDFVGTPSRPGYTFNGWYPVRSAKVDKTVTYTAQWKIIPPEPTRYTVRYTDGVEGVEIFEDKVFEKLLSGDATPSFGPDPVREGYDFVGWSPARSSTVTGSVTYTAEWKRKEPITVYYSVRYTDGAEGEEIFADRVYENLASGSRTPTFDPDPVRDGFDFIGWSPEYSSTVSRSVTYSAVWKAKTPEPVYYKVTYSDGTDEEIFADKTFDRLLFGVATPAFGPDPVREGYTFEGWSPAISDKVTATVTYSAIWKIIPPTPVYYSVTYSDGVEGEVLFPDKTFGGLLFGDPTPSFGEDPVREGYIFDGWNPAISDTVTGDVRYTPVWKYIPVYSIRYTDGVEGEEIFPDVVYENIPEGTAIPAFPEKPCRQGYEFAGWYPPLSETAEANVTYVAQWTEKKIPLLIIDEENHEATVELVIESPKEGEKEIYEYLLLVLEEGHEEVLFHYDVIEDPDNLAENLKSTVICEETGEILYSGDLCGMPEAVKTSLSHIYTNPIHYRVIITPDDTYEPSEEEESAHIRMKWWVEEKEPGCPWHRHCLICFHIGLILGHSYSMWPWCWIIYLLIIWHIVMYLIGKRRNKKIIEELTDLGALDEVIEKRSYRKRGYIWLGVKTTLRLFLPKKKITLEEDEISPERKEQMKQSENETGKGEDRHDR